MAREVYEATAVSADDVIEGALDSIYKDLMGVMGDYPQLSRLPQRSLREPGYFRYNKVAGSKTIKERPRVFESQVHAHMAATDCDITILVRFPAEDFGDDEPFHRWPDIEKKTKAGTLHIWHEVMAADTDQARMFRSRVGTMIRGHLERMRRDLENI